MILESTTLEDLKTNLFFRFFLSGIIIGHCCSLTTLIMVTLVLCVVFNPRITNADSTRIRDVIKDLYNYTKEKIQKQ